MSKRWTNNQRANDNKPKNFYEEISDPYFSLSNKNRSESSDRSNNWNKNYKNIFKNSRKSSIDYSTSNIKNGANVKIDTNKKIKFDNVAYSSSKTPNWFTNLIRTNTKFSYGFLILSVILIVFLLVFVYVSLNNSLSNINKTNNEINDLISSEEDKMTNNLTTIQEDYEKNVEPQVIVSSIPKDIEKISSLEYTKNKISYSGSKRPSESNINKLNNEVNKIVGTDDVYLSFCLIDIVSQNCIYYNIDEPNKTFSCLKAPFVSSAACQVDGFVEKNSDAIYNILKFSDNSAYDNLWFEYGTGYLQNWFNELKITEILEERGYPEQFKVSSMTKLWLKIYEKLETNASMKSIADDFLHSKSSAIDETLGTKYIVRSKAGWGDGSEDYSGTNDAGIVYVNGSPYVLCIFSGYNYQPESLYNLISCLDDCQKDIKQ